MTQTGAQIFRDYETDGVPASGAHNPLKSEIRDYLTQVETSLALVNAAVSSDLTNTGYRNAYVQRSLLFNFAL